MLAFPDDRSLSSLEFLSEIINTGYPEKCWSKTVQILERLNISEELIALYSSRERHFVPCSCPKVDVVKIEDSLITDDITFRDHNSPV